MVKLGTPADKKAIVTNKKSPIVSPARPIKFNRACANFTFTPPQLACHSLTNGNDVAFVFPFEKSIFPPPVLWANKVALMECSPYFVGLFSGGFLESENVLVETSKFVKDYQIELAKVIDEERGKDQPKPTLAYESEDDDEDTDWTAASALIWRPSVPSSIHYVIVRDVSHKLYEAFLKWQITKEVYFAPLNSNEDVLHFGHRTVSVKAIFKLANHMDVKSLEDLAISSYEKMLTPANVLEELFSPICCLYPRMKRAAFRGLDTHWEEVVTLGGLDKITSLIQSSDGDPKEIALTTIEILRKSLARQSVGSGDSTSSRSTS